MAEEEKIIFAQLMMMIDDFLKFPNLTIFLFSLCSTIQPFCLFF